MNKILFLTEAGDGVGYGHLTRMLAIREEFCRRGYFTLFLVHDSGNFNFNNQSIELCHWLEYKCLESQNIGDFDVVIIDSYLAPKDLIVQVSSQIKYSIAIDDYNRISYPVSLLINPNLFFNKIDYSNQKASVIGGEEFVILRDKFRGNTRDVLPNEIVKNVLITVGGSDTFNLLPTLCKLISSNFEFNLRVICPDDIKRKRLQEEFPRINLLGTLSEHEVFDAFVNTDLVISGCGQTLHELASMGKAVVGFCIGEDQLLNQEYYVDKEFLNAKFDHSDSQFDLKLIDSINNMLPLDTRVEIFNRSKSIINKNGVGNIVDLILKLK